MYKLFAHLKTKFNGNLFELGNEMDSMNLTDDVFMLLNAPPPFSYMNLPKKHLTHMPDQALKIPA